jgi:diketogulonate reductase-like aldo/keto reductase
MRADQMNHFLLLSAAMCAAITSATLNIPTKEVAVGVKMPVVSIGTWTEGTKKEDKNISAIVGSWLDLGGRGIDTAYIYFDQHDIAEVLAKYGIPRENLFITSKLPTCLGSSMTKYFLDYNLKQLNTSFIDLMLIHAPGLPGPLGGCDSTWKVMEDYVASGKLKSIGVSNWHPKDFQGLKYKIAPAVNQVEFNVFSHDDATEKYCNEHNITIEAYSPLGDPVRSHRSIFHDPTIASIAAKQKVSPAQVALRWILQKGHVLTFLSSSKEHQANSADLFGFELDDGDVSKLDAVQHGNASLDAIIV